jgi:hypothetical protein
VPRCSMKIMSGLFCSSDSTRVPGISLQRQQQQQQSECEYLHQHKVTDLARFKASRDIPHLLRACF